METTIMGLYRDYCKDPFLHSVCNVGLWGVHAMTEEENSNASLQDA